MDAIEKRSLLIAKIGVEEIFLKKSSGQDLFIKNANVVDSITTFVKNTINNIYDPERPLGSILNILTPAALAAVGFAPLALIVSVAQTFFGFNLTQVFEDIKNKVKGLIQSKGKVTESEIKSAVNGALSTSDSSDVIDNLNSEDIVVEAFDESYSVQFVKVAGFNHNFIKDVNRENLLAKEAGVLDLVLSVFKRSPAKAAASKGFLASAISWLFTTFLYAGGFVIAREGLSKLTGIKPKIDPKQKGILPDGTGDSLSKLNPFSGSSSKAYSSTYKPHKLKPGPNSSFYIARHNRENIWVEGYKNKNTIKDLLVDWTVDFYPELKGKEDIITSVPEFNKIYDLFLQENNQEPAPDVVGIPMPFQTLQQVVDEFAGQVYEKIKLKEIQDKKKQKAEDDDLEEEVEKMAKNSIRLKKIAERKDLLNKLALQVE